MKKFLLKIPVLLIFALGAAAQQPARIQQDVKYLASDALEGRLTGTKGATEAAHYIAKEFSRLGLKPLISKPIETRDRYLQSFPYVAGVSVGKGNSFLFGNRGLEVGTDWLPLGFSASGNVGGSVVFVGYGITASELNYNDYASVDATRKIA